MIPMQRECDPGRLSATLLWLLVATAFFVEQLVDVPADAPVTWSLLAATGWMAWALLLRNLARQGTNLRNATFRTPVLTAVATAAFFPPIMIAGWSMLSSSAETFPGAVSTSPEGFLLVMFRGVVIALLALGRSPSDTCLTAAASLFLVVASLIAVEHPAARVGIVTYALLGGGWLVATRGSREPVAILAAVGIAIVVAVLGDPTSKTARTIAGFVPLSGGDGWAFPWARGGSGNGEDLIAAREKPTATGPVDSNIYVTSHKPSLYDLWTDIYGEPEQPKNDKPKRAFGLAPDETIADETHLPESVHAGREFTTARRGGSRRRPEGDLAARGLLTVTGPAPVHIRLEAFDAFDGIAWRTTAPDGLGTSRAPQFEHVGKSWMRWPAPQERHVDAHEITVGTLATPVLPLPSHTTGLRIDRIDRADFFREPSPGIVSLETVDVPAGTRIESASRAGGIDGQADARHPRETSPARGDGGSGPRWVAEVIDDWELDSATPTWEAAARVVAALGEHCALDRTVQSPAGVADTLEHFLCDTRRGPDYCFAGAAVLLLRELGFDSRLANGLYMDGNRRDPRSRKLVAVADDAHFWAEVRDSEGRWVPVEATPGYALRLPAVPWWEPLRQWFVAATCAVIERPIPLVVAAFAAVLASLATTLLWRPLTDAGATATWRLAIRRRRCCPLVATWRLLEWRAWLAGHPRPRHATARGWYLGARPLPEPEAAASLARFIPCFEQSVYGSSQSASDEAPIREVAQAVARHVTRPALARRTTGKCHQVASRRSLPPLRASLS